MTLQQLICLGVKKQLPETGFVFVLGNKDKQEPAAQVFIFVSLLFCRLTPSAPCEE